MSKTFIQLDKTTQMNGFEKIDLSDGFACDMETGICGPTSEIKNTKKLEKENNNENNSMV